MIHGIPASVTRGPNTVADDHADDAVEITAPCSFGIGETAETQDEENRGADIGNCNKTGGHDRDLTCGTSPACGG
jgi:hypothetical protein